MTTQDGLSPRVRALVERAREARLPTEADRARVRAALSVRLGPTPPSTPVPEAYVRLSLPKVAAIAGAIAIVGVASMLGLRSESRPAHAPRAQQAHRAEEARAIAPPPATASTAPVPQRPHERTEPDRRARSASGRTHATPIASKSVSEPRVAIGSLEEELRLLTAARAALRDRPTDALAMADEHDLRFAPGALREEITAVRAIALCALGRSDDARIAVDRLVRDFPRSSYLARVRRSCAPADFPPAITEP